MSFWDKFDPPGCYPDRCGCEAMRDSFIRQPVNFLSSFAYFFSGYFLYKKITDKSLEAKLWIFVCFLMGLTSSLGHMSFTRLAMALDFASIILILSLLPFVKLFEMLKRPERQIYVALVVYYALIALMMYFMGKWPKIGVSLLVGILAVGDLVREVGKDIFKERLLQYALLSLSFSFGFFVLDESHFHCDPFSIFQWHSLWHIGTAYSMYLYGLWRFK